MKILHMVREIADGRALETARAHAAEHEVTLVLLQDAVLGRFPWDGEVCVCREDLEARGAQSKAREVEYKDIIRMIFGHDRVIMW